LSEIAFKCVLDRKVVHIELPGNTSVQESSFIPVSVVTCHVT